MAIFKKLVVFLFLFLLPTQLGKHFFLDFSYVDGVRVDYLSLVLYATDILALMLVWVYREVIIKELRKQKHFLVFLGLLVATNILASQYPVLGLYSAAKLLEIYIIYVIFSHIRVRGGTLLLPLFVGGLVQLFLALLQFHYKSSIQGIFYYLGERFFTLGTAGIAKASFFDQQILRPYGTFSHPNSLGGFYLLLYAFVLSLKPGNQGNFLRYGLILISSLLVLLSFSRVAIVVYVVITLIHIAPKLLKKDCLPCLIGRTGVLLIVSGIFLQVEADPLSLEKRILLIKQSLLIIKENLILGTGFGHHLFAHAKFPNPYPHFFLQPVHNIFLLFLEQAGAVITILILIPLHKFIRKRGPVPFFLPLLVVLFTGLFDHYWLTLQQNMLLMGVIFGLMKNATFSSEE
ncbi:hypothetical protein A3F34_00115 [Candidatus Roizmanbacteria bacterium RIFCSPHIGHO2_12_FULL_44_10]|uniref:O-antigen ligase-related domain-containing protein n=1 Tax=Candidatus Roizmanbacteria bacterium RIFCSPHIGHO2_12_FULL_44_10 TaxID=1802054 RepID=A0A1F7I514_9BACT|nr:MAG: hypothetical protein A3F34_00115 [Candidatus Roizmanbacteria bacterium RIFCSPHIGHO2_12_FULL_44_10]